MKPTRKNVRFYLRPERAANEAAAITLLDGLPDGWQADVARDACLAGLALRQVDNHLFTYLASTLSTQTDPETLRKGLIVLLSQQPLAEGDRPTQSADYSPLSDTYYAPPMAPPVTVEPPKLEPLTSPPVSQTQENLRDKFPD